MPHSGTNNKKAVETDSAHKDLPKGYGTTMAALLPRDPEWLLLYWEISSDTKSKIQREHGQDIFEKAVQVLRVYPITPGVEQAPPHFDIPAMLEAGSWYINVRDAGRRYCCEPGLVLPSGNYLGIVKSNTVSLPACGVSDRMEEKRMSVSPDFEKLLRLSGVEYIGKGSGEVTKSLDQRREMLRSVFSRASSWGVSALSSRTLDKPPPGKLRLAADCELVLYGATEPDAFVTVAGRRVKLNPDGTFSMRFALPDGNTGLPIRALSNDEKDSRRVEIDVTRRTCDQDRAVRTKGLRQIV
ncbi:MAG: hypothetical protein COX65_06110 [Elusimicrobia bacterium CG_4_10_14_0_2_um_filter_56_8]|nr:MAG: hypothetical protein AUJ51_06045 [Elusimicrobia bacterium CG1_02_56_21]PJA14060.1 MAG: hypothetical protein COX65_06110 [Elusimicrobia bacterium CG_4_10_14_0_2_um_filter_56_8]